MFKSSLRAEILNSVYSDVYLKVRQVFLETINRGRDAVVVVPVGFMDSYANCGCRADPVQSNFIISEVSLIVVSPLIIKITISPIVIDLKKLLFPTNSLLKLLSDSLLSDTLLSDSLLSDSSINQSHSKL